MLRLLGPARVNGFDGRGLNANAYVLVACLEQQPNRTLSRELLAERIWGGASARASANLRQLLLRIREWEARTGQLICRVEGDLILRDSSCIETDLQHFAALAAPRSTAELRRFNELYAGDFLASLSPSHPELEQWLMERRSWLRDRFIALGLKAIQRVRGPVADAVATRLVEEAPYDESVARAVMVLAAEHGTRAVRQTYEAFRARLEAEIGTAPAPETRQLLLELSAEMSPASARMVPDDIILASRHSVPTVLIMPPTSAALEGDERRIADGFSDDLTHALSRMKTFAVFAPHTARQLNSRPFQDSRPYGADFLVTTRLVQGAASARLLVSLMNLKSQQILLGEELIFTPEALPESHFQLAAALGGKLASGIQQAELQQFRTTGSASAYVHYLLGSDEIQTLDLKSLRRAKRHFRQALKLSADFAPARSMLARTHSLEWVLLDRKERQPIDLALALARESAAADPLDPIGHREVGHALIYLDQLDEGVESLATAARLGPHHADILAHYADGLVHIGDSALARPIMDRALSLNPLPPDHYLWIRATSEFFCGDYPAAASTFSRMKHRQPAARFIAASEAMSGNLVEAELSRDLFLAAHPDFHLADYVVPLRSKADRERYFEGLRRAGFT